MPDFAAGTTITLTAVSLGFDAGTVSNNGELTLSLVFVLPSGEQITRSIQHPLTAAESTALLGVFDTIAAAVETAQGYPVAVG